MRDGKVAFCPSWSQSREWWLEWWSMPSKKILLWIRWAPAWLAGLLHSLLMAVDAKIRAGGPPEDWISSYLGPALVTCLSLVFTCSSTWLVQSVGFVMLIFKEGLFHSCFPRTRVGILQPMGQIQPEACSCRAWELRMFFTFLNIWKNSKEEYYFRDTWELYEIQISVSINKVL